jgi:hypothetical protein
MAGKLEWQTHWHQLVTGEPVSGQLLLAQIGNIQEPSVGTEGNSFGQGADLNLAQLKLRVEDLGGTIRIRDALHARVRGEYTRVVYPYFSEEPALPEEGGRLGLWVMQQALTELDPDHMRVNHFLRRKFVSPQTTPPQGNEEAVFRENYRSLIGEWERLKHE